MGELLKLTNIGKEIEGQLNKAGIFTYNYLKDIGAKQAWLKILEIDDSACINKLLVLEGAIRGIKKSELPPKCKADLKDFYNQHKAK